MKLLLVLMQQSWGTLGFFHLFYGYFWNDITYKMRWTWLLNYNWIIVFIYLKTSVSNILWYIDIDTTKRLKATLFLLLLFFCCFVLFCFWEENGLERTLQSIACNEANLSFWKAPYRVRGSECQRHWFITL